MDEVARKRAHRGLAFLVASTNAANAFSAAFVTFHLLERWLAPWQAALMASLTFTGALAGAALVGLTPLGSASTRVRIAAGILLLLVHYDFLALLDALRLAAALGAAVTFGMFIGMFWIPTNAAILTVASDESRGTVIGGYGLLLPATAVVGPLAGGWVVQEYGLSTTVLVAVIVLVIALAWLLAQRSIPEVGPMRLDRSTVASMSRGAAAGLFSEGVYEGAFATALPILATLHLTGDRDYGNLLAGFSIFGAAAALALARWSDRIRNRVAFIRVGAATVAVAAVLGLAVPTLPGFFASLAIINLGLPVAAVFLFALASDSSGKRKQDIAMWREVLLNSGRLAAALAVLGAILLGGPVEIAFLLMLAAAAGIALAR